MLIAMDDENPTIDVLLCAAKNDLVVRFSLPKDNRTILASQYQLYLPTESQLVNALKKELAAFSLSEERGIS